MLNNPVVVLAVVGMCTLSIIVNARVRKTLVIARYNETLEWLADSRFDGFRVVVYNKGSASVDIPPSRCRVTTVVTLPNVGREAHTYLYHIIKHYENPDDLTLFVMGSSHENIEKRNKADKLVKASENSKPAMVVHQLSHREQQTLPSFQLDTYHSSTGLNSAAHPRGRLHPAPTRPFGSWHDAIFGQGRQPTHIAYNSFFSATRKDIWSNSKHLYKSLLAQLETSSNPESGHYMERSWASLFPDVDLISE